GMNAWECDALQALAKNALEMARVVRGEQLGRARHMEIIQARDPETVRARTQHVAPMAILVRREWANRLVCAQQRFDACIVKAPGRQIDTPVVDGDRDVEEPLVVAGEIEI